MSWIYFLTKFKLKITMIGEDIAKNVILDQIWSIFGSSLVQIVPKIPKFKKCYKFLVYTTQIQVLG